MDKQKNKSNLKQQNKPKQANKNKSRTNIDVEALQNNIAELEQKYARAVADYQNLEKRVQKEKEEWINFANVNLLTKLLDILDNLNRASAFITDPGLKMIKDDFDKLLKEFSVEEIQALGAKFDHHSMECIETTDPNANTVTKVVRKGYKLHNRILRPAQVVVGQKTKINKN